MKQASLFEITKFSLPENFTSLAKEDPALAYHVAVEQGYTHELAIWDVIKVNFETDWSVLWDGFELNGVFIYCNITIGKQPVKICEEDSEIYFNNNLIFTWGENEVFDDKTMSKIKTIVKRFVFTNKYQFKI